MSYTLKPLQLTGVAVLFVTGVWLVVVYGNASRSIDPEVAKNVEASRPLLPEPEKNYLTLLEHNIISGGPPKDGIPSIDKPKYSTADEANKWLRPNDVVFGVAMHGLVVAYPQRILVWHEIVNDHFADRPVSLTYCPLTGTAIGYYGNLSTGAATQFGVSGKLVNSNLIMYDRASDSYWPQILGKAITGPARGMSLQEFPTVWTTWERWKRKHPNTRVLSRSTGFFRGYGPSDDPYGSYLEQSKGYYDSAAVLFDPIHRDGRLHPKAIVIGIRDANGSALAIKKDTLRQRGTIEATLGSRTVIARYDPELDSHHIQVKGSDERLNGFDAMWFAWVAFYPETHLIS
jgi:hypothetical protein